MKTAKPKTNKPGKRKPPNKKPGDPLRKRSEALVKKRFGKIKPEALSDKETQQLIHELQTHQIELEIQNEELRNAQLSLEEARKRYADLYDFAPVGYFTLDRSGIILEANLTGASMLGVERVKLLKVPFMRFISREDQDTFYLHRKKVIKTVKRQTCELQLKKKDGGVFYASLESVLAKGNLCRTMISDITRRKQAEKEVKHPASFTEFNPDPVIEVNFSGKVIFLNPATEKFLKRLDLAKKDVNVFLPGDIHTILGSLKKKKQLKFSRIVTVKDRIFGESIYLVPQFSTARIYIHDITARKQAEAQLAADLDAMRRLQHIGTLFLQESNLEPILTEIVDAAIAISKADFGNIQLLDARSADLRIVAQRGFPKWWLDFWNSVAKGKGTCGTALERGERVIVEDVEQSPVFIGTPALEIQLRAGVRSVQSTPLVTRAGRAVGMFSTHYKKPHRPDDRALRLLDLLARHATDIIEWAQAEESLRLRSAELETVNKDLEAYSYTISHDLKTPLRSIEGFSRALSEDYSDRLDDTGRDYLNRVNAASRRMSQLIEAMLTLGRLTKTELREKTVNLSDLARIKALELKRKEPGRKVKFIIAQGLKTRGDGDMLRIVLDNLLDNAWKFTSRHTSAKIEFGAAQRDGEMVYYVRDNGAGFDMEYADNLFLPFKRFHSESEFPGLGIGLSTADRIIHRHSGKLWAESEPGKGAVFYFTLGEDFASTPKPSA